MKLVCTSPFNVFKSEEDKGIVGFLKKCRVPTIIDRVQEAIAFSKMHQIKFIEIYNHTTNR